jgi:transglutaminase-like putative cysteine protease
MTCYPKNIFILGPELTAMNRFYCLLLGIFLCYSAVFAKDTKPKIEKQPAWVTPVKVVYNSTGMDDDAVDGYSDLHYERQVSLAEQAVFVKKTMHVLSEAGIQNLSQISVNYQPSYQQLSFHTITILRNNKLINKLDLSKLKTIQQETELDRFLYNGALTAVLFLEDIRKDDIVEYSYTLQGFNPIFKNKHAEFLSTRFNFPLYNIYYKLIVPKGRTIRIKNSLTDSQPVVTGNAAETVYEWTIQNQEPMHVEENIPSWYDAYPTIMVSEFNSWKEVNDWALELFPFTGRLSAALQEKVNEMKANYSSPEARLLATIRFTQDDVRYMGIEMGEHSHKPHAPSQVFEQRFGDCKDKSYLLCTLLKAMGIEAYPVLINTSYKKTVHSWLPTPTAFDHVTVNVVLNGKNYWFDPTISHQRGSLQDISYPNYQTGLVVKPGTTGFTTIPLQNPGKMDTREVFYIKNMADPVGLTVTTRFSGAYADNVRYKFQVNSTKDIQKGYKEFFTPYFKKIAADSISYSDDEASGTFTTREYYTLRDFWKTEDGKQSVLLEPYLINNVLNKPEEEKRNMPFALPYPARYTEEIEVHLPGPWKVSEASFTTKTAGFTLAYSYSQPANDIVLLHYSYESTADHIPADATQDFADELAKAEKSLAFELSNDINGTSSFTTSFNTSGNKGYLIAYLILGFFAFGTYLYRMKHRKNNYWD